MTSERTLTLRFDDWPVKDRDAWLAAIEPNDFSDEDASDLADLADRTKSNILQAVEAFFLFLGEFFPEVMSRDLPERFQRDVIEDYCIWLACDNLAPSTIVSYLERIHMAAIRIGSPNQFHWLRALIARARPEPTKPALPPLSSRQLLSLGRSMMRDALMEVDVAGDRAQLSKAIALYRDGLTIATSAVLPLRATNYTHLEIGVVFFMRDRSDPKSRYNLKIPAHLTKNMRRIPRWIPRQLSADYDIYFDKIRPLFGKADSCEFVLMGKPGKGLSYQGLYRGYTRQIMRYTKLHMNPHKSRNAAANAAASMGLEPNSVIQDSPDSQTAQRKYMHDRPAATCKANIALFKL